MPLRARAEHLDQLRLGERRALGGALDLDQAAGSRHHEIRVGLRIGILLIVEVEHGNAAARCRRRPRRRGRASGMTGSMLRPIIQAKQSCSATQAAGDRGGARAAVGLEDVAVDHDLLLAEANEVDDGAQASGR